MSRRPGYRSQRRPQSEATCTTRSRQLAERAFEADCLAVAKDCPSCDGAGSGCGACGGLGFVAAEDWKLALQRAFVQACALVPPCEADGWGDAA